MAGNPAGFESIGSRLGFRIEEDSSERLFLQWRGPRFPAFLCLGIALLLLFVSVPISQAIYLRGFASRAASLWYFPLMNFVLIGIAIYLMVQKRWIVIDSVARMAILRKRGLFKTIGLSLAFGDIKQVKLGLDEVYGGFAVGGSSAAQSFPVPALRLLTKRGDLVLVDRGSAGRLAELGQKIAVRIHVSFEKDPALR